MRIRQPLIAEDIETHMSSYEVIRISSSDELHTKRVTVQSRSRDHCKARVPTMRVVYNMGSRYRVCIPSCLHNQHLMVLSLGQTITSAYTDHFLTHVYSALPATFAGGFKTLIAATLANSTTGEAANEQSLIQNPQLWACFETLGLTERYEALVASVCYEHIESHVVETCAGEWEEPMLTSLRDWMADRVVPWMLLPYARGAKTGRSPSFPHAVPSLIRRIQLKKRGICCKALAHVSTSTYARRCAISGESDLYKKDTWLTTIGRRSCSTSLSITPILKALFRI